MNAGPETRPAAPRVDAPQPYRLLFPLGVCYAIAGAITWPAHAAGSSYPGPLHAALMIQGFQQCFVLGFFLTAMPAFTRGERCRRGELTLAVALMAAFGALASAGLARPAEVVFGASIVLVVSATARRILASRSAPPEEFVFVLFGFACGLTGSVLLVLEGAFLDASPRLGAHLISLGMVLSLVLGFGGLLVPTFTLMREPLAIPGIAKAHERGPRRMLYVPLALVLALAFVAEATGRGGLGSWLRALAATALVLLAWKLYRRPGRRDLPSLAIWCAGWFVLAGLWTAALAPAWTLAGYHIVFIGGFGLLTLGIATRVVGSHGGHGMQRERSILTPPVAIALMIAVLARVGAEWIAPRNAWLSASAALWIVAWGLWAAGAIPAIVRVARASVAPIRPE